MSKDTKVTDSSRMASIVYKDLKHRALNEGKRFGPLLATRFTNKMNQLYNKERTKELIVKRKLKQQVKYFEELNDDLLPLEEDSIDDSQCLDSSTISDCPSLVDSDYNSDDEMPALVDSDSDDEMPTLVECDSKSDTEEIYRQYYDINYPQLCELNLNDPDLRYNSFSEPLIYRMESNTVPTVFESHNRHDIKTINVETEQVSSWADIPLDWSIDNVEENTVMISEDVISPNQSISRSDSSSYFPEQKQLN